MVFDVLPIQKSELMLLMLDEANKEGWSYSTEDVNFYFDCHMNRIYVVKVNGKLAGCVILHASSSIIDKKPLYSAGFFLVVDKYRGQKIGSYLWQKAFTENLQADAMVCFHSVPRAISYYEKMGYNQTILTNYYYKLRVNNLKNLSNESIEKLFSSTTLRIIDSDTKSDLYKFNSNLFIGVGGLGICDFVSQWINRSDALIVGYYDQGNLQGYGVVTVCSHLSGQVSYRISPLYALNPGVAQALTKGLVYILAKKSFAHIELNTLSSYHDSFSRFLKSLGFIEAGKNYVVCNHPTRINHDIKLLNNIFCSIPLEYPHEAIAGT